MYANNETANFPFPVLVVEDSLPLRILLQTTLQDGGYDTVAVENGREALERLRSGYFPIVISDCIMPEVDGLDLCRTIRAHHTDRYTYIILITAKNSRDDLIRGLDAGADEYLVKPVHELELLARLRTARRILGLERSLKQSLDDVRKIATRDPLTRVYNRGYMDECLPLEAKRASRYQRPLTVIMCDIDRFKNINDSCGHYTGDQVLRGVADSLRRGYGQGSTGWRVTGGGIRHCPAGDRFPGRNGGGRTPAATARRPDHHCRGDGRAHHRQLRGGEFHAGH